MSTLTRPPGLRAGFHAHPEDPASGVVHAGEQWAAMGFFVGRHSHPMWELYLQLHGVSRWRADGRRVTLRPGDLFGVAPGVEHEMVGRQDHSHHFSFVGVDVDRPLARQQALAEPWHRLAGRVIHVRGAQDLVEPFAQLMREVSSRQVHSGAGLALTCDRLVLEVVRVLSPDPPVRRLVTHPAVLQTRTLLDREYARNWRLGELAERVGLAPTYLAGLFTAELGVPPYRYLHERRIDRARHLLVGSDLPVTTIGVELGFSSSSHFARVFRQATGSSPREYRRAGGGRR